MTSTGTETSQSASESAGTWLLLVFDGFLEDADRLGGRDFDRKDVAGIITMDETVKLVGPKDETG